MNEDLGLIIDEPLTTFKAQDKALDQDLGLVMEEAPQISPATNDQSGVDLELGMRQKEATKLAQQQQMNTFQALAEQMNRDPANWTIERTKKFFKDNPAKTPQEEAIREVMLDEKNQAKEEIKRQAIAQIQLPKPKSLRESIQDLITKPFIQDPEEQKARDQNVYALAKTFDLPEKTVRSKYEELSRSFITRDPTYNEVLSTAMILPITAGLATHPLATVAGLGGYQVLSEIESAVVSKIQNDKYQFFRNRGAADLLPEEANQGTKDTVEILDMVAKGLVLGGVMKKAPELAQRFTKDIVTEYKMPKTLYLSAEDLRAKTGPEFQDTLSALGLDKDQIAKAWISMREGKNIQVELPAEQITMLADRPFWAKIKSALSIKPFEKTLKVQPAGPVVSGPQKLLIEGKVENRILPSQVPDSLIKQKLTKGYGDEVGHGLEKVNMAELESEPKLKALVDEARGYTEKATVAQVEVNRDLDAIATELGLTQVQHAQQKSLKSVVSKALRKAQDRPDYTLDDLTDYGRGTLILDDFNTQAERAIQSLLEKGYVPSERFGKEGFGGFRILGLTKKAANGLGVEMQLSSPEIWKMKREFSDALYRENRHLIEKPLDKMTADELRQFNEADQKGKLAWKPVYAGLDLELASIAATSSGESLTASARSAKLPSESSATRQAPSSPKTLTGAERKSTTLPLSNLKTESNIYSPSKESLAQKEGIVNNEDLGLVMEEAKTGNNKFSKGEKVVWTNGNTYATIVGKEPVPMAFGNGPGWKIKLRGGKQIFIPEKQLEKIPQIIKDSRGRLVDKDAVIGEINANTGLELEELEPDYDKVSGALNEPIFKSTMGNIRLGLHLDHNKDIFINYIGTEKKGTGLGTRVVEALKEISNKTGVTINTSASANNIFWEKMGFKKNLSGYMYEPSIISIEEGESSYYSQMMMDFSKKPSAKISTDPAVASNIKKSPLLTKFNKTGSLVFASEKIESPADVAFAFKQLKNAAVEHLYCVGVKGNKPICVELISIGTINASLVDPLETTRLLLDKKADGAYLIHNHPSGDIEPSEEDLGVSARMHAALSKLGIKLKGHVVIDDTKFSTIGEDGEVIESIHHASVEKGKSVPVYKKYVEWLKPISEVQEQPSILGSNDVFELMKGLQVDPKVNDVVLYLDTRNRVYSIEAFPHNINFNRYAEIVDKASATRSFQVIIATGQDPARFRTLKRDLHDVNITLLDVVKIGEDFNTFESATSNGSLDTVRESPFDYGAEEQLPEPMKELPPDAGTESSSFLTSTEKAYDEMSEKDRALWELEMDDLNKTPEANLFVAIRQLGGIRASARPDLPGALREEYNNLPLTLKNKNGLPLDEMADALKAYGWQFEGTNDLLDAIMNWKIPEKVNRAALRDIIRASEKNALLKQAIEDSLKKRRKFITTVKNAEKTNPEVAATIESLYTPITNAETLKQAQEYVTTNYDDAVALVEGPGRANTFQNAVAIVLIDKAQAEGRFTDAIRLVEKTAEKQTELGQAIQALSMYARLTPEGILKYAEKQFRKARELLPEGKGPKLTPEMAEQLKAMAEKIKGMPEGREKQVETALMMKKIADQVPPNLLKKISMLQTMAQLLNPKTFIRNILGNVGFMALENVADVFGTALDVGTSLLTGTRTQTLPSAKVQAQGLKQGLAEGTQEALLGIDLKNAQGKFDLPRNGVFDTGVLGALEKAMRVGLQAPDRANYQAAYNESLRNQMKISGASEPTPEMIERAHWEGLYRTFQDDNVVTRLFVGLKKALNLQKDWGLGDMVIKYPKTPASILARGIEYSPFGFIKVALKLGEPLFGKPFNQEEFIHAGSRAFTGSALLVGVGAILAGLGIITGKRAKDKDVAATRENVGIREYQINTSALKRFIASGFDVDQVKIREDDTLVNYDWFLPGSIGVAMGANLALRPKDSVIDKTLNLVDTATQASETLTEQPLVQGLKVLTRKENIVEGVSDAVQGIPASFVPALLNQVKQLTDNTARNTKDPNYFKESYNKVLNRIPGASGILPERITTLGEDKDMYQGGTNNPFNVFLNPAFVNRYKPDPVSEMVLEIWESTGETIHFPRVAAAKVKLGADTKEPIELSADQYTEYQRYIGNRTGILFSILRDSSSFQKKDDGEKAKILSGYLNDINTAAKIEVLGYRPKKVSGDVLTIIRSIKDDMKTIDDNDDLGLVE